MESVDVSIITPTFRRGEKLLEAVDSALSQQGVKLEMLILDDSPEGSAEPIVKRVTDSRVRYIKQKVPSGGRPAQVRNDGAKLARGRYVYCLDDDDRVAQGALADVVAALDARPKVGVAVGQVVPFGEDPVALLDKRTYFEAAARVASKINSSLSFVAHILFRGPLMVNSACVIRRELIAPLGGYDTSMVVYEDIDFFMRAIRQYGHVYINRPILHYRTGAPSLMHDLHGDNGPVAQGYEIMYRKYREQRGELEFHLLKGWARFLPSSGRPNGMGGRLSRASEFAQR